MLWKIFIFYLLAAIFTVSVGLKLQPGTLSNTMIKYLFDKLLKFDLTQEHLHILYVHVSVCKKAVVFLLKRKKKLSALNILKFTSWKVGET